MIIEGEGLPGVTVTLAGGPADESYTTMTDVDGMYRFEELRPGDYTVSISDFDTRDVEFAATSQDVSVDLDEVGTVSFTGVNLRTSGISGRVSVEGMGLGDIAVTLSGAADASTTTDAGGQYSFTGLAAGGYTVTIAVEGDAYVFASMSSDVTLGDDDSQIVSFDGAHARTASVSGMVFLDEATKNDMYDEGETALAHAGIPVALVGPGVNEQRVGATDATGAFSFTGLRAGAYQLVFLNDAATAAELAANHVAYGGSTSGYAIALEVGDAATQNIPFDITHTTVNFTVSLRHGDDMGAALPGATVTLYSGDNSVGSDETGDDGSVSIAVARAGVSGNMVQAGVSADGYHVADGMTDVSWDPRMFATAAGNANDIVNLNVDVSISGATVTTDAGGGEVLAGWAIGVTMGDAAVAGAPTMLGDDGTASFTATVAAGDLPATYTFSVAEDQDDALDGDEMYEGSDVEYEHDGLSLAGTTMDADPIEVNYTTQTLKVYVYKELDQVHGYTGNILGGDKRMSGLVDLEVRHIGDNGLSRPFTSAQWDAADNTSDNKKGGYTFAHLPADADVVVLADAKDGYKLLDPYRLDTYRNIDENGVMGGAFGAMGGWGHTVSLCPLTEVEPTGQDFGQCGSFAVVSTYAVSGQVWKNGVRKSGTGFKTTDARDQRAPGTTVSLTPAEGKNLAGDARSFTTASSDDKETEIDERVAFNFGPMAAGVYDLVLPDGWRAMRGAKGSDTKLDDALSPLDAVVQLDITPSTGTLYGVVSGNDGFGLANVTVHVNGESAVTDDLGRYIVSGFGAVRKKVFVHTSRDGFPDSAQDSVSVTFAMNSVTKHDIALAGAKATLTVSGTVRESGTNEPIKGVRIMVDGKNPLNGLPSGSKKGQLLTGDDGAYTAIIPAKTAGGTSNLKASKSGYVFTPDPFPVPALAGTSPSANFTGYPVATISGRVIAPGGGPMAGVAVLAFEGTHTGVVPRTGTSKATVADSVITTASGTFSLDVSWGAFTIRAKVADADPDDSDDASDRLGKITWFDYGTANGVVPVAPSQVVPFGNIQAKSAQPRLKAKRLKQTTTTTGDNPTYKGDYTGKVELTWEYESATGKATVANNVNSSVEYKVKVSESSWRTSGFSRDTKDASLKTGTTDAYTRKDTITISSSALDSTFNVRVGYNVSPISGDGSVATNSDVVLVDAVDTQARDVVGSRVEGTGDDAGDDIVRATWSGANSPRLRHRVVLQVVVSDTRTEWLVASSSTATRVTTGTDRGKWRWSLNVTDWSTTSLNLLDGTGSVSVTKAMLEKALMVRVDTQNATEEGSVDRKAWVASTNNGSIAKK